MVKAVDVAAEMLNYAASNGTSLTHMQLQKLIYIAHGFMLTKKPEGLLDEEVNAWKFGPVIDQLYQVLKKFGAGRVILKNDYKPKLQKDEVELIHDVVDRFKKYDGVELSELTHKEGSPWYKIWHDANGKEVRSATIPNEIIKAHYENIISNKAADVL